MWTSQVVSGRRWVSFAKARSALNVSIRAIVITMALEIPGRMELYVSTKNTWYYQPGCDYPVQLRYYGFEVMEGRRSVYFMLFSGSQDLYPLDPMSHTYVYHLIANRQLNELHSQDKVPIPTFSVFPTSVTAPWRMWLVGLCQCRFLHVYHLFKLGTKNVVTVWYETSFSIVEKTAVDSTETLLLQELGGTNRINKKEKLKKDCTGRGKKSAEDTDWIFTAASIPQN